MSVPKWKKLLSYLTEVHIESLASPVNDNMHLSMKNGRFMLCTDNAIYSYDDYYLNYKIAINQWEFSHNKEYRVLSLGFGMGSAALILQNRGVKIKKLVAIEYDPAVIQLASDYSVERFEFPVSIIEQDAAEWLAYHKQKYDLIIMDIFVDVTTPPIFRTNEFTHALSDNLTEDGCLMYNFLDRNSEDKDKAKKYFNEVFKTYFPDGGMLKAHHNLILVNDVRQFEASSDFLDPSL